MARKPAVNTDALQELGAEKLAQLILDETKGNAGFKRKVSVALAGRAGPEAMAKLIDKRLAGLERARSFVDWDKEKAFRADLKSLTQTIISELGPAAPEIAFSRLMRFITTHQQVFERIDDSYGRIQDVYYDAIEAAGEMAARLKAGDAAAVPDLIMQSLGETSHGYLTDVAQAVIPHLPEKPLAAWDASLAEAIETRRAEEADQKSDGWFYSMTGQWALIRQCIALKQGDLDLLISLESQKDAHRQDVLSIAEQLLEAGRLGEALDWVRKPGMKSVPFMDAYGNITDNSEARASIEARILDAMGKAEEARKLRWASFSETLSAEMLNEHLKSLPDFEDAEAEDAAIALAHAHESRERALALFMNWPRHDEAAKLIISNTREWDGADWRFLPEIAEAMEHARPLAASILYRALTNDILARARSTAYGHGGRYLHRLSLLAADAEADAERPEDFASHADYLAALKSAHGRKAKFWAAVDKAGGA